MTDVSKRKLNRANSFSYSKSHNLVCIPTTNWHLPTILNLNSSSVVNKLYEITHLLDFHCVDIAGVTETWLSDTVPPSITTIDGYSCERRDRVEKKGGGVLAYIRKNIPYNRMGYMESNDVEFLWVLVRGKCMPRQFSHILIVVVYVQPNACDYTTINHIVAGVDDTLKKHPHVGVMLIGDFNQLNDTHLRNYLLGQVVRRPTRGRAVLDKIFTNMSTLYCEPVILAPTSHSDHNTVLFEPASSFKFEKGKMVSLVMRANSLCDKDFLSHSLSNFDWTPIYLQPTCQSKCEFFQNSMAYLIRQHLPTKKVWRHTTDKPWVTDHFRYLINWRQYAYMSGNTTLFRSLRNIVFREAKTIRATYYHQRIQLLRNFNPRRWWKHTKAITALAKTTNEFVAMANALCDGKMSSHAEEINLFFESVCSELNPLDMGTLPTNCRVPVTYIFNTETVTKLLNAIKINKAIGLDDIPNWILRDHANNLTPPICAIFNDSIREGYIPALWKCATLIPIPKVTPARKIEEDLRPISLTAVLSKHLESFVGGWILDIIVDKLHVRQYGGMRGLSTTHALIDMVHNWLVAADERMASHVVLLDYRKAFDHVDHTELVNKCKMYGLPGFIIRWIGYFISDRSQRVRLGQEL